MDTTTVDEFAEYYYVAMRKVRTEEEATFFRDSYVDIIYILEKYYGEDGGEKIRRVFGCDSDIVSQPKYSGMYLDKEALTGERYSQLIGNFVSKINELIQKSDDEREKNILKKIYKKVWKCENHYVEMRKLYENGISEYIRERLLSTRNYAWHVLDKK